ncbi:MAG: pilus assembly protein [Pirellulaceae bacterium]|nr:pilus assembly protein [Planctomycetales bacterium]
MISARANRRAKHRGAVTVEFALVIGLFFMFLIASIEFARFNIVRHVVDNAAYEAARKAIVPGATAGDATDTANAYLATIGTQGATVIVDPDPIEDVTEEVSVTVNVPMDQNTWVVPIFTGGATVSATSTLRCERYRGIE